jgi:hypothetical protein
MKVARSRRIAREEVRAVQSISWEQALAREGRLGRKVGTRVELDTRDVGGRITAQLPQAIDRAPEKHSLAEARVENLVARPPDGEADEKPRNRRIRVVRASRLPDCRPHHRPLA